MYVKPSNFPDFVAIEHRMLTYWQENEVFTKLREQISGKPPWSFVDGPITANNPMGVHHAWGRTLKDIFQRYHAMQGFDVRFQNGFDCQGLWVEVEVEKALGFKTKGEIVDYGMEKFVRECKERVLTFAARQTEQSIRLGYWQDWDDPDQLRALRDAMHENLDELTYTATSGNSFTASPEALVGKLGSPEYGGSYFTFSDENNYTIWRFLKQCHEDGDLARATDVMPWCTRCGTGLSQMEVVEGRKIVSHDSVYVRFPIVGRDNEAFLIWTTTPWTLPANVAVALNPKMTYLKIRYDGWIYYVGKDNFDHDRRATLEAEGAREKRNLPSLRKLFGGLKEEIEVLDEVPGDTLIGLSYSGPFDHLEAQQQEDGVSPFPMATGLGKTAAGSHVSIAWSDVTGGEGSGIVHIAPGCGTEDYGLGLEHDLPVVAPLDGAGNFLDGFGALTGQAVSDASSAVIDDLRARGLLVTKERYNHVYPHCWRCSTELVFRLVDGWKVVMDWRGEIANVVPKANWVPAEGEKRELDWLRNMGDWLISKNRFWGLALPIWECESPDCDWFTAIGSREELQEKAIEGWDIFDGHSPHRPYIDSVKIACECCGGMASRVPEVGNPWLDAGVVALSTLRYNTDQDYWKKWFPADLILESFPGQFRNWFYSLLAMSVKLTGQGPFRSLLGYALVHDERGEEMHKSKGNSIEFDEAAELIGAEPMRFIYASQPTLTNLNFPDIHRTDGSKTLFDEVALRKIMTFWNCYKFFLTYSEIENWQPSDPPPPVADRDILDRWILSRLQTLIQSATENLGGFRVHRFMAQMELFNEDLSNWYLRRSRTRFWSGDATASKDAALHTLYEILKTESQLFAPILPFLAEEVYQTLVRVAEPAAQISVHLTAYPQVRDALIDKALEDQMDLVIQVKNLGLSLRNQSKIRVRQPLSKIYVRAGSAAHRATLEDPVYRQMIMDEINVLDIAPFDPGGDPILPVIKINFRTVGAKIGGRVQDVKRAVDAADPAELHDRLIADGQVTVDLDGEEIVLSPEDLIVSYEQVGDLVAAAHEGVVAALETTLTDELIAAGYVRDLNREVQMLRKGQDLEVTQRIRVNYATSDAMAAIVAANVDELKRETLAVEFARKPGLEEGHRAEIGGDEVLIVIEPATA